MRVISQLWNLLRRHRLERDIAEELATHAALLAEANRTNGTQRRLGSDLALRERTRAADVPLWLDELLRDLGFARRSLWRSRGFTLVAVATLALGIGAATAMFSVVNTVLLHPLPFPHAERLLSVRMFDLSQGRQRQIVNLPVPAINALRNSSAFASVGVIGYDDDTVSLDGTVRDANVALASRHLFGTLGVHPELGRGVSGSGHEALVSDRFWRTQLGGTAAAIGQPIRVGRQIYTIVGVIPPGQQYPPYASLWIEGVPKGDETGQVIARLPGDVPFEQAQARARAAVAVIASREARSLHHWGAGGLLLVPPLHKAASPQTQTALWVLFAAVGCLLLIACGNTANLLLGRGLSRQHELSVRCALGAGRWRLMRLLLAEGLWLALAAGAGGAALAWWLVRLARLGPASIPRLSAAGIDPATFGFAVAAALTCGIVCALGPALRLSHARPHPAQHLRRVFVVTEVALTLVLLTGGVLLLRSFNALLTTQPGLDPHHVTVVEITAPPHGVHENRRAAWPRTSRAFQSLLARIRSLPGVTSATYANHLPFTSTNGQFFYLPGTTRNEKAATDVVEIGPRYFATLHIPLLAGRAFTAAEENNFPGKDEPVIVNAALAAEFWPGVAPAAAVGRRLPGWHSDDTIVGVAANTRDNGDLTAADRPQAYYPLYGNYTQVEFLLRSPLPPAALAAMLQPLVPRTGADLLLGQPTTLDAALAASLAQPRLRALLLLLFAALAWGLAVVGLYGVLAYEVRQRRHEIGIRMALGADRSAVLRWVLGDSMVLLAVGLATGWLLAWLLARYVASLLFGVGVFDPVSWLGAGAALLAAGLLASLIPARRALRVDPAATLRAE